MSQEFHDAFDTWLDEALDEHPVPDDVQLLDSVDVRDIQHPVSDDVQLLDSVDVRDSVQPQLLDSLRQRQTIPVSDDESSDEPIGALFVDRHRR